MLCVAFFHTQEISGSHIDIQDLTWLPFCELLLLLLHASHSKWGLTPALEFKPLAFLNWPGKFGLNRGAMKCVAAAAFAQGYNLNGLRLSFGWQTLENYLSNTFFPHSSSQLLGSLPQGHSQQQALTSKLLNWEEKKKESQLIITFSTTTHYQNRMCA